MYCQCLEDGCISTPRFDCCFQRGIVLAPRLHFHLPESLAFVHGLLAVAFRKREFQSLTRFSHFKVNRAAV
jgi:hypothetical protein